MVRAWYIKDEDLGDDKLDKIQANNFIDIDTLTSKTGIEVFQLPPKTNDVEEYLNGIKNERGFSYEDTLEIRDTEELREKMKKFATEHLHDESEIRFVLDGCTYFDIRDDKDCWVRIEVTKGDLIILPAGIYHRLTLDVNKFVRLRRLFYSKPIWTSYDRPADNLECRQKYIQSLAV